MARPSTPYEELEGGQGKAIHYRPERHRAKDLLREYPLEITVDGHEAVIDDLAMNGLAFHIAKESVRFGVGTEHVIELRIGDHVAHCGRGRVARVPQVCPPDRVRVAVRLIDGFVDIRGLVDQHEALALAEMLDGGAAQELSRVPANYRAAVERAVHFAQYYRSVLDRQEKRILENGGDSAAIDRVVEQSIEALREPWKIIRDQAATIARAVLGRTPVVQKGNKQAKAMKAYTETMLTPLFLDVPILKRAYEKPLGYPGDYDQMMYIYRNQPEGDSVFAKVFHKLAIEEPLAAGVRTRKDLVKTIQEEELARTADNAEAFKVTSIACGPAKEVEEFVREQPDCDRRIEWSLVDQEEQALSLAYESAYRALAESNVDGDVQCLYSSFRRMVAEPELFKEQGERDFIYAAGLFDYLRPLLAQRLIIKLVENLKPGGLLAIGNARADEHHFWSPEFMLDWSLLYRTEEDMMQLANNVPSVAHAEVRLEESGGYWFLLIRKEG